MYFFHFTGRQKKSQAPCRAPAVHSAVQRKGFAVHTLRLGRIAFVGTDRNLMERAVVFAFGVVGTVVDCAADAAVASFVLTHGSASFLKKYPGTAARAYIQFAQFLRFYA